MQKRKAIYPGSFDPITFGHLDLLERAKTLFDEIWIVIGTNADKTPFFSPLERLELLKATVKNQKGIHVDVHDGLTVDYAISKGAYTIIRGLRATSDFDYEFQMAITNRQLTKKVDTVFLMPSESHFYISSRLIREIAMTNGDITKYVPAFVAKKIHEKIEAREQL